MEKIDCLYVDQPYGDGVSDSWRVVGADYQEYLVKFNSNRDRTGINELVCSYIAKCFELPIFEPVIINLNKEQCNIINAHRAEKKIESVESGEHFGSMMIRPFYTVAKYEKTFGHIKEGNVVNLDQVPDIFGFDSLIQNDDRHCNNVCVLYKKTPSRIHYYIFDHGHAFGGPNWDAQSVKERYQSMRSLAVFCMITSAINRFSQFDKFLQMFDVGFKKEIDGIFQKLPRRWKIRWAQDLRQLQDSIRGTSKDDLVLIIKGSRLLEGMAQ